MGMDVLLKMLLAAMLGGLIGLERELAHKEAGLRVNVLIAIGATFLTVLAVSGSGETSLVAVGKSLFLAHVVSAIAILGAAVIIRERFVGHGISSAATLWSVGAIGITIGCGYYLVAFAISIFIVLALFLLRFISYNLEKQGQVFFYVIATEERAAVIVDIKKVILELGLKYLNAHIRKAPNGYEIEIALNTSRLKNQEFIQRIMHLPAVKEITSENL